MLRRQFSRWMWVRLGRYILPLAAGGFLALPAVAVEQTKLTAADGAPNDFFGASVSIDGNTAVVGAPGDDDRGRESGSAYVFVRTGSTWTQQAKLTASDGDLGDRFGTAVDISGDTIVVGAPEDESDIADEPVGSVYVFVRSGSAWIEQSKLPSPAWPSFYESVRGPEFGASVSISGDSLVVGSPSEGDSRRALPSGRATGGFSLPDGSAWVFVRTGTSWHRQAYFDRSSRDTLTGTSVSISGEIAVVGAPGVPENAVENPSGPHNSAADVWVRSGRSWNRQATLRGYVPATGSQSEFFGTSVAVSRDTAVVGEPGYSSSRPGSVYVFARSGTTWIRNAELMPSDSAPGDRFGGHAEINAEGSVLIAGGLNGQYIFVPSGTGWTEHGKLTTSDGASLGEVRISDDTAIAGAARDDDLGSDAGAAYIFVGVGGDRFESRLPNDSCDDGTELTISGFHRHFETRILENRRVRLSQEIWRTSRLSGLSLHNGSDKDFFRIVLPNPSVEHPNIPGSLPGVEESLMECGQITRNGPILVNGAAIVRVIRPRPGLWQEPIELSDASNGRSLYVTPRVVHSRTRPKVAQVNCPRGKGATEICIAIGNRPARDPREILPDYEIEVEYRIDLVRISKDADFLQSLLESVRERATVIPLRCPGGIFPDCDTEPGVEFTVPHPVESLPDCRADGPFCPMRFPFWWEGGALDLKFRSANRFSFELLDGGSGKAIDVASRAQKSGDGKSIQEEPYRLFVPELARGLYALTVNGQAGTHYTVEFSPPPIQDPMK